MSSDFILEDWVILKKLRPGRALIRFVLDDWLDRLDWGKIYLGLIKKLF